MEGADTMSYTHLSFSACPALIGGWWLTCRQGQSAQPGAPAMMHRLAAASGQDAMHAIKGIEHTLCLLQTMHECNVQTLPYLSM